MPEIGIAELKVHPVHLLDEDDFALLELWQAWRGRGSPAGGLAAGHLPFAGGVADQPACVIRALAVMDVAAALLSAPPVEANFVGAARLLASPGGEKQGNKCD